MTDLTKHARRVAAGLPRGEEHAREIVRGLGAAGLCRHVVPKVHGGASARVAAASLCAIREGLAYESPLADELFAMQGLGSYPVTLAGPASMRRRVLPRVAAGDAVAAFALTEPEAGSDAAALRAVARRKGRGWALRGTKAFISNAGIADVYVVFARSGAQRDRRAISAFLLDGDRVPPGAVRPVELISPHPIGSLTLDGIELPADSLIGREGDGFRIAMETLDLFRATVAAAACGMAWRALDESVAHARRREQFGRPLAKFQAIRFKIADMATQLAAARRLVEAAASAQDGVASAMAKLFATEAAQRVVDEAVQIHGGAGLVKGHVVEALYRDVRALRIYEGTSEIQRLVIANAILGK